MRDLQEWLESLGQKYTLKELKNLTHLDLYNSNLTILPESIGNLKNLTILSLASNKITLLQTQYDFLNKITYVFGLKECKIIPDTQLAKDLFL